MQIILAKKTYGTRALEHARHVGTQDTRACKARGHVGTWARKARVHVGTWPRKARGYVGTQGTMARRARRARDLADSFISSQLPNVTAELAIRYEKKSLSSAMTTEQ